MPNFSFSSAFLRGKLNVIVLTGARDFAGGATEALRWTLELCRVDVPHVSVLNVLVLTGARDFVEGTTEASRWTEIFSGTRTRAAMLVRGGVSNSIADWA